MNLQMLFDVCVIAGFRIFTKEAGVEFGGYWSDHVVVIGQE
jgi:hypothetical protein